MFELTLTSVMTMVGIFVAVMAIFVVFIRKELK